MISSFLGSACWLDRGLPAASPVTWMLFTFGRLPGLAPGPPGPGRWCAWVAPYWYGIRVPGGTVPVTVKVPPSSLLAERGAS